MKTINFKFIYREGDIEPEHWLAKYIYDKAMSERRNIIKKSENEAFDKVYEKEDAIEILTDDDKDDKFDKYFKENIAKYNKNKRYKILRKGYNLPDIKDTKTGIFVKFSEAETVKRLTDWGELLNGTINIPTSVKWDLQDVQTFTYSSKNNFEKALLENDIIFKVNKLDNDYDTHIYKYKVNGESKTAILSTYAGLDDVFIKKYVFKGNPPKEYIDYLIDK